MHINHINLEDVVEDAITWNLTTNGQYSMATSCKAQFLGPPLPIWRVWCGRFGLLQKSNYLHGLHFKIGFRRLAVYLEEVGQIANHLILSSELQNRSLTSSSISATLCAFGTSSRIGLATTTSISHNGKLTPSKAGGKIWWLDSVLGDLE